MDLRTLFFLSAVVASGSGSPVQPDAVRGPPPSRPVVAPREALNIGPHLNLGPADTLILNPVLPTPGCTTTISRPYSYPCSWDGTTTIYPSTTVAYRPVDCGGCSNVRIIAELQHCPNMQINGTARVNTPYTVWSTVCLPTLSVKNRRDEIDSPVTTTADSGAEQTPAPAPTPSRQHGALARGRRNAEAAAAPVPQNPQPTACPTTLFVQPPRSAGPTATTYASWTTSTLQVPCGGCDLTVSTALAGYGPPATFETTTTLPVGTVTAYACAP
jgi:hypothetical protein